MVVNPLIFMLWYFAQVLKMNGIEIHVRNMKSQCEDPNTVCDGKALTPFGSIYAALQDAKNFAAEESIEFLLEPNDESTPYLILNSEIEEGLVFFSPFQISQIKISTAQTGDGGSLAYISLRTQRLIFEFKKTFILENLVIHARDLPAIKYKMPCLNTFRGCCDVDKLYMDKKNPCFTYAKSFRGGNNYRGYFSLINGETEEGVISVIFNNISVNYFNPTEYYTAFLAIRASELGTSLQFINMTFRKYFFVAAPIVLTSTNKAAALNKLNFSNFSEISFNPFLLQSKSSDNILLFIEGFSQLEISDMYIEEFRVEGYIFSFASCGNVTVTNGIILKSQGGLISAVNIETLSVVNTKINNFNSSPLIKGSLIYLFLFLRTSHIYLQTVYLSNFSTESIMSPFRLSQVNQIKLSNFILSSSRFLNTGLLELFNVGEVRLINCGLEKVWVSVGGMINSYSKGETLSISNSWFKSIRGPSGSIIRINTGSTLGSLLVLETNFSDVDCVSGLCFDFQTNMQMKLFFNRINFNDIRGTQFILGIYNRMGHFNVMLTTLIKTIEIRNSNISFIYFNQMNLITYVDGMSIVNCNTKSHLLFKINNIIAINFNNISILHCSNQFFLAERLESYWIRPIVTIANSTFENISGDASIHIDQTYTVFRNCKFLRTSGKGAGFFIHSLNNYFSFHNISFHDQNIDIFAGIFLQSPFKAFSFSDCSFLNFRFLSSGTLITFPSSSSAEFRNCTFKNISGNGVYLIALGQNVSLVLRSSKFINIYITGKGGVFFMAQKNRLVVDSSEFRSINGIYEGLVTFVESWSILQVTRCKISEVTGSSGSVFYLGKDAILAINGTFIKHVLSYMMGGVIVAIDFKSIIVENCVIAHVTSYFSGGIMYSEGVQNVVLKGFLILKNSQFENITCRQDGAIASIVGVDTIFLEKVKIVTTNGKNAGGLLLKHCNYVEIKKAFIGNAFVYEKAGCFWVESVGAIKISDLEVINASSKNLGVLILLTNSMLSMESVTVSLSSGSTLIHVKNEKLSKIKISNISFMSNSLTHILYVLNNQPESNTLELLITNCSGIENDLNTFLFAINVFSTLKDMKLNFNLGTESFENVTLIHILGGVFRIVDSFFEKNGFHFLLKLIRTSNAFVDNINVVPDAKMYSCVLASFAQNISATNSYFNILGTQYQQVFIYNFYSVTEASLKNITLNGTNHTNPNRVPVCVVLSTKSMKLSVQFITMHRLFLNKTSLFDIEVRNNEACNIKNIEIYDLNSFSGTLNIKAASQALISFEKLILINRNQNDECSLVLLALFTKSAFEVSSNSNKIWFSEFHSLNADFVVSFINFQNPIVLANFSISTKQSNQISEQSGSALRFSNCLLVEVHSVNISNLQGQRAMEFVVTKLISARVLIKRSVFQNCISKESGGALFFLGAIEIEIFESKLSNNSAFFKGGAIYVKNPDPEKGSFLLERVEITGNMAGINSPAIAYVTHNIKVIKSYEELKKNNVIDNNHKLSKIEISESLAQVSSQPFYYRIFVSPINKAENISIFSGDQNTEGMSQKISPYSGRSHFLELEIFDVFKQPNFDLSGLIVRCEANASEKYSKSLIFYNNEAKLEQNKLNLSKFEIVSRKALIESQFTCKINFLGSGADDLLENYFSTDPLNFYMRPCKVGQILRQDRCVTCQNSYSFVENITSNTYCLACPLSSKCNGSTVSPLPGFWNYNLSSLIIIKCQKHESCLGGEGSPCSDGYTGNICYNCSPGWAKYLDGSCLPCNTPIIFVFTIFRLISLYVMILALVYLNFKVNINAKLVNLLLLYRGLIDFIEIFNIAFSLNFEEIPLFYYLRDILSVFSPYGRFTIIEDCLTANINHRELNFLIKSFIAFLTLFILSSLVGLTISKFKFPKDSPPKFEAFGTSFVIGIYTFLPQIGQIFISVLTCKRLLKSPGNTFLFLIEDPNIMCYTSEHIQILLIPISMVTLITFIFIIASIYRSFDKPKKFNYFSYSYGLLFGKGSFNLILLFTKISMIAIYMNNKYFEKMSYISLNIVCLMVNLLLATLKDERALSFSVLALNYALIYLNAQIFIYKDVSHYNLRNYFPFIMTIFFILWKLFLIVKAIMRFRREK